MRSFLQVEGVIGNKYVLFTSIKSRLIILLTEIIGKAVWKLTALFLASPHSHIHLLLRLNKETHGYSVPFTAGGGR
jgi:hypothetical protein